MILSPNPAQDFVSIDIVDFVKPFNFKIYTSNGMLVYDNTVQSREQIPVSDFDEGIYFYTVLIDDKAVSGKFVVLR